MAYMTFLRNLVAIASSVVQHQCLVENIVYESIHKSQVKLHSNDPSTVVTLNLSCGETSEAPNIMINIQLTVIPWRPHNR